MVICCVAVLPPCSFLRLETFGHRRHRMRKSSDLWQRRTYAHGCLLYADLHKHRPAHVHDASCYTLTCGKEEHTHTDACYEDETTAGIAASLRRPQALPLLLRRPRALLPSEAATALPSSETATGTTPSSETTTDITTSPQTESSSASDSSESATDESVAITKAPASESSPQGNIDESQTKYRNLRHPHQIPACRITLMKRRQEQRNLRHLRQIPICRITLMKRKQK